MAGKGSVGGKQAGGKVSVGGKNVKGKAAAGSHSAGKGPVHLALDRRVAQDLYYALTLALGGSASGAKSKPKPK